MDVGGEGGQDTDADPAPRRWNGHIWSFGFGQPFSADCSQKRITFRGMTGKEGTSVRARRAELLFVQVSSSHCVRSDAGPIRGAPASHRSVLTHSSIAMQLATTSSVTRVPHQDVPEDAEN